MFELIVCFAIGFIISYMIVLYHHYQNDFSYLLTTIKEDVTNMHVSMHRILDKVNK